MPILTPQPIVDQRIKACESCEIFIKLTRQCNPLKGGCGCFIDIKARIADQDCPNGHWSNKKNKITEDN